MAKRNNDRASRVAAPAAKPQPAAAAVPDTERVAVAAYYRAEKRGFQPGAELEDWLAAEEEVRRRDAGRLRGP